MTAAVADYAPAGVYRIVKRETQNAEEETQNAKRETQNAKVREVWVVENVQAAKVKSTHGEIAVRGVATEKLIDLFRGAWGFKGVLIKFKLEAGIGEEELVRVAGASRVASGADLMVANTLAMARPAGARGGGGERVSDR